MNFTGIQRIFSTRLMLASLLLLQTGCILRVVSEALAYEGILGSTSNILPISGVLEITAVPVFAANLALTFAVGRSPFAAAHLHHASA